VAEALDALEAARAALGEAGTKVRTLAASRSGRLQVKPLHGRDMNRVLPPMLHL